MKLATIVAGDSTALAAHVDGELIDLTRAMTALSHTYVPRSVTDVISADSVAREALDEVFQNAGLKAPRLSVDACTLLPPHLPRGNVFCVGVNYDDHLSEAQTSGMAVVAHEAPTYFSKDPRAFCGAYDDIVVDSSLTQMLDWEAELAVIIGRPGRNIAADAALEHVFGYTVVNDVSARDVQASRGQWFLGKNLTAASPIGPYVVTADEVTDPQQLTLTCTVDGEVKQHASTQTMVHSVAALITDLSRFLELQAGDVISTGTPAGVGAAAKPPQFLLPGSRLVTEISRIGRQENVIRAS